MADNAHSYCDYLTLTCQGYTPSLQMRALVTSVWPAHTRSLTKRMQFDGWTVADGSIFFGSGDIAGHLFYMLQASGAVSHELLGMVAKAGVIARCTRIDLQKTVEINLGEYNCLDVVEETICRTLDYYVNPSEGTSTIYTGSKKSRKLARLYVKRLYDDFLRLEFQLRRDYSRTIYDQIVMGGQAAIDIIYQSLVARSAYPDSIKKMFYLDVDTVPLKTLKASKELSDLDGYLQHLDNIHKSLERSLGDDTRAGPVREWILRQARMLDRFP